MVSSPRTEGVLGAGAFTARGASLRGKRISKVVPAPGSLSTWMWPPLCFTIPWTVARPSPVPFPRSLVVKKGSKRCAIASGDIPIAGVPQERRTHCPRRRSGSRADSSSWTSAFRVSTVRDPAARHGVPGVHGEVHEDLLDLPGVAEDRPQRRDPHSRPGECPRRARAGAASRCSRTTAFRSSEIGAMTCLRAKARSCRVRSRARSPAVRICSMSSSSTGARPRGSAS